MAVQRSRSTSSNTRVCVVTADAEFEQLVRSTFSGGTQIELMVMSGGIIEHQDAISGDEFTVVVVDLDDATNATMVGLQAVVTRLAGWPPVVAVTDAFDKEVARQLLQMRVADFLVKPVQPIELMRSFARVIETPAANEPTDAEIIAYLPAVGGAGVTTLAIQTALLLRNSGGQKMRPPTCLVDLNFQQGACADYLDLEPRLDLNEIEPRPERLDRQLLEVMLSYHASGLAVIAAPNRPAEMRTFDPLTVTRLLDLVSTQFKYVVIDLPRTWFQWTDSVLLGSNRLYIVSEMTVPGLKHAKHLVAAIRERLSDGPQPRVIINRFEQGLFTAGLRKSDVEQTLGDDFAAVIPNDYRLVREAIDRGVPLEDIKPGNKITAQLRKLIAPSSSMAADKAAAGAGAAEKPKKKGLLWKRA